MGCWINRQRHDTRWSVRAAVVKLSINSYPFTLEVNATLLCTLSYIRNRHAPCLLIILGISEAQSSFDCPVDGTTGDCLDGPYGNPYDCTTYWSCTNCVESLQECPEPLEWSETVEACVSPADSGCTGKHHDWITLSEVKYCLL